MRIAFVPWTSQEATASKKGVRFWKFLVRGSAPRERRRRTVVGWPPVTA